MFKGSEQEASDRLLISQLSRTDFIKKKGSLSILITLLSSCVLIDYKNVYLIFRQVYLYQEHRVRDSNNISKAGLSCVWAALLL